MNVFWIFRKEKNWAEIAGFYLKTTAVKINTENITFSVIRHLLYLFAGYIFLIQSNCSISPVCLIELCFLLYIQACRMLKRMDLHSGLLYRKLENRRIIIKPRKAQCNLIFLLALIELKWQHNKIYFLVSATNLRHIVCLSLDVDSWFKPASWLLSANRILLLAEHQGVQNPLRYGKRAATWNWKRHVWM